MPFCKDCRFHLETWSNKSFVTHVHGCTANLFKITDFVTGKTYESDPSDCYELNHVGECKMFQEKETNGAL